MSTPTGTAVVAVAVGMVTACGRGIRAYHDKDRERGFLLWPDEGGVVAKPRTRKRTKRRRQGRSLFAGKPYFDSKRFVLRPRRLPPCGMDPDQLNDVLSWVRALMAHGTTSPVRYQVKLRAYVHGGSVFATSVEQLLADPQFHGAAHALDVRVYALTRKERRRIYVEFLPGLTRVNVRGESGQWVQAAYHATVGLTRQHAVLLWQVRNAWVAVGGAISGSVGQIAALLTFIPVSSFGVQTRGLRQVSFDLVVAYAGSVALMLGSVGLLVALPRPLVEPNVPWWGPKQRVVAATTIVALLVVILGVLILRNGTTSPDLIAAIGVIVAIVIGLIPLLGLRKEGGQG